MNETELHRQAWRTVVGVFPGATHLSHEVNLETDWDVPAISGWPKTLEYRDCCPTCGDPADAVGLTFKCRDWHEVCRCGRRYDEPKAKGCRRRKHPKVAEK